MADRAEEIEQAVRALASLIEKNLAVAINRVADIVSEQAQVEQVSTILQVPEALVQANLEDVSERLEEIFAAELDAIRQDFKTRLGSTITFSGIDGDIINALLDSYQQATFQTIRDLGIDLQSELTRQVITGAEINIDNFIETETPRVVRNLITELDTAVLSFNRSVTVGKAEELGLEYYVYFGPNDKVTRPFCDYLLGDSARLPAKVNVPVQRDSRVYTKDEIARMDNGQGLDPLTFCGGWNCRHQWRPISESEAKRRGYPA